MLRVCTRRDENFDRLYNIEREKMQMALAVHYISSSSLLWFLTSLEIALSLLKYEKWNWRNLVVVVRLRNRI